MDLAAYADKGDYSQTIESIVYSNAYKRLAHKTQIIIKPTRDHFRSRLIHTEEVNQIALSLGRKLKLNLELITAIAKAHDLGHTPFGHAGERTVQLILERELSQRFNIKLQKNEKDRELFRRKIFHHSLNSARMLIKDNEFEGIPNHVVDGVLTHSWSPWKQNKDILIPTTYEAQIVAIADQLSSINHDIEDVIEGATYTEYDKEKFTTELINGFKTKHNKSYEKLRSQIMSFIVDKCVERGYGRQKRVELFATEISDKTLAMFKEKNITQSDQATDHPICLSDDWGIFLEYCEKYIRDLIQERISWFIARDHMAGALISTVFNHIWPRARAATLIGQMKLSIFDRPEIVKTRYEEKTKYREHFVNFFNEHYFNEENKTDYYKKYLDTVQTKGMTLWDNILLEAIKHRRIDDDKQTLIRLVAVVDFIAGLTDRYCLEIFNEVYQEFVIT